METVYLHSFYQKLQRDRHGMGGKREDGRVQTGFLHTGERTPFPELLYVCMPPIDQLADQHSAWPAAVLGSPCKEVELESSCG